jgi:LPS export ABC transporter protein LptC
MTARRNLLWLIPLIFLITFPLWSVPVGNFLTPRGGFDPDINKEGTDHHNFSMQTVTILQNQQGKNTAIIRAEKARTNPEDLDIVVLESVDADVFDDDGRITKITSQSGQYNLAGKNLTLTKDVVLNKIEDQQMLYTDLLVYNSDKRNVNCPGRTRLVSPSAEIIGGSFDYDIPSKTYLLDKRVKCQINGFIQP